MLWARATSGRNARRGKVIEGRLIAMAPTADGGVQSYVVAALLCPVLLTMLPAGVTHPAGAAVGAGVVQHPVALCRGEPCRPG